MASKQNTLIVLDSTTIATNIKLSNLAELIECSQATGYSLSQILNRAAENWLAIEAPVYFAHAKETQSQRV